MLKLGQPLVFFFAIGQEHLNNSATLAHAICTRPWMGAKHANILVLPDGGSSMSRSSCPHAESLDHALNGPHSIHSGCWATLKEAENWGIDLENGVAFNRTSLQGLVDKAREMSQRPAEE